jgi:phage gp36-like protein
MPYCTKADILNLELTNAELITLTDDKSLGEVATAMVTAAIAKADAEIDGHCQAKYTVPFVTVPPIVMGWSATLAAFNLYRNRPKPSTLVDRYNKVMSWLTKISEGKMSIPGATDTSGLPGSTTDGTVQTFRRTQTDINGNIVGEPGSTGVW